jgi:hypothetical protein
MCGWGAVDVTALEVTSDTAVFDATDERAAGRFNAAIKRVLWASLQADGIQAFAGPALVPVGNPLASCADPLHHVHVAGTYRAAPAGPPSTWASERPRAVSAPPTEWFVRARFPGLAPHPDAMSTLFATAGLQTISSVAEGNTDWRRISAISRARVDSAIAELRMRHRVRLAAIRAL